MSLDTHDATERVEQLIVLTERLTAMIRRESDAFEAHRPRDVLAGAEETARLANLYRHESMRVRREPALIAGVAPPLGRRLMEATRMFDSVLARHGRAVAAAKTITEGLVLAIAEDVVSQRPSGYGQGGSAQPASATALTLDRQA